ncbi:MAG: hypothetical protein MZW92_24415 [Comamonadaceae bacterium]|nr:hypothetical protein [Comamonadaceae bacterium]
MFVWDGQSDRARLWHLLVRRELDGSKLKFCLSNAKPKASLRQLATMQASRHFVERAFEDAKSHCGMADYQVRGWNGWHHHMSLVAIAPALCAGTPRRPDGLWRAGEARGTSYCRRSMNVKTTALRATHAAALPPESRSPHPVRCRRCWR